MRLTAVLALIVLGVALVPIAVEAAVVPFSASGADAAAIQATVDTFRGAIGGANNGVGGSFTTGRREINWDGVPANFSSPNAFPPDFFNVNSPRGVVFSTPGSGFQVSGTPPEFGNLNATYPDQFTTFSAPKLFTAIGSTITDVNFFIPGTTIPATTRAFGAVFTDVDSATSSSIAAFDANGGLLGTFSVPAAAQGLSFLGLVVDGSTPSIGRVRITSGNAAPGPNDAPPGTDVAVMDDFIYGEPTTTVPEPTTLFLLGSALVGLGGRRLAQAVRALRRR
ncbi:MAG TPA: PEP-CTERM sorting domain-containing protein [Methylomirabilota bacterium]|jgi:hypothetical protein